MEANNQITQTKSFGPLVILLIVVGMVFVSFYSVLNVLGCWNMMGYVDWEFQPLLHRPGVTEEFHLVHRLLFAEMLVAFVFCICILFFLVKLLQRKKYGFWGVAITSVLTAVTYVMVSLRVLKAFQTIEVKLSYSPIKQIVWEIVPVLLLFAILQIRKDGVSCWKRLE